MEVFVSAAKLDVLETLLDCGLFSSFAFLGGILFRQTGGLYTIDQQEMYCGVSEVPFFFFFFNIYIAEEIDGKKNY